MVEDRRDVQDLLLGSMNDTERVHELDTITANHAAQHLRILYGAQGPSATSVRIFTSHRDQVTTIYLHDTVGVVATAFRTALEDGMHANQPQLVVDLGGVSFLNREGLEVLVAAVAQAARRGKRLSVHSARPAVFHTLTVAGLITMLDVHPAWPPNSQGERSRMSTTDAGGQPSHEGDLDTLKGIGTRYRAILEEVGVASITELRHRDAARLKAMIEKRHGAVVGLSEDQVQTWIDEAKVARIR